MIDRVGKLKILYAEDQADLARLVKFKLEKEGYLVFHFNSGENVLDSITEIQPDLVLLDIMMPITDGITILKGLRAIPACSNIPVIFLTGVNREESIVNGLKFGATDYIIKPFSTSELLTRIKKILNSPNI